MNSIVREYVKQKYKLEGKELTKKVNELIYYKEDPFKHIEELPDLVKATKILTEYKDKKLVVLTDYDCDGLSSAAIAKRVLKDTLKLDVEVYNNKRKYGNGVNFIILNEIGMQKFKDYDVLITADHGSVDDERYKYLKELNPNLKIIVTDHHTIPKMLEHVDAFINNQREDNKYYKDYSGCCIFACLLYNFVKQVSNEEQQKEVYKILLAFMALTIQSDVMSLADPLNRYIYKKGIPLLYSILKLNVLDVDLKYEFIPMINSGNRMHKEELGYQVLTETDLEQRAKSYTHLSYVNQQRKEKTRELLQQAYIQDGKIAVATIETEYAVGGIVASGLLKDYPAVVCIQDSKTDTLSGSARSSKINILKVLQDAYNKNILTKVGGHTLACGLTLPRSNLHQFLEFISNYTVDEDDILEEQVVIHIDRPYAFELEHALQTLKPFGQDFEEPIFSIDVDYMANTVYQEHVELMFRTPKPTFIDVTMRGSKKIDYSTLIPHSLNKDKLYRVYFQLGRSYKDTSKFLYLKHEELR